MPKKILLADDSITIQKVVELTFSDGDYDVIAVNNGAKAIQKIGEVRPDIILSDIIMPEKNGYEVCEYVKSHPEFRRIPVILLTGTFEPFDPDRAEKAGCDAVVTKPFESQSLIHKVEELIAAAAAAAPATSAPVEPAKPAPQAGVSPSAPPDSSRGDSPFASTPSFPDEESSPFAEGPAAAPSPSYKENSPDLFARNASAPSPALPFEPEPPPVGGGDTRAFPSMSFDEIRRMQSEAQTTPPKHQDVQSAWGSDEPAAVGETLAFPKLTFEELQKMQAYQAPEKPEPEPPSPSEPLWADEVAAPAPSAPLASSTEDASWDEGASPFAGDADTGPEEVPFGTGEREASVPASTPAFGESVSRQAFDPGEIEEPYTSFRSAGGEEQAAPAEPESSEPIDDMFDQTGPAPPPPQPTPAERAWSPAEETVRQEIPAWEQALQHTAEEKSAAAAPSQPEPFEAPAPPPAEEPAAGPGAGSGALSDDQVERIARRVVQLMSEQMVRNIAWEVIPDLAENIVRERIRQLENE